MKLLSTKWPFFRLLINLTCTTGSRQDNLGCEVEKHINATIRFTRCVLILTDMSFVMGNISLPIVYNTKIVM